MSRWERWEVRRQSEFRHAATPIAVLTPRVPSLAPVASVSAASDDSPLATRTVRIRRPSPIPLDLGVVFHGPRGRVWYPQEFAEIGTRNRYVEVVLNSYESVGIIEHVDGQDYQAQPGYGIIFPEFARNGERLRSSSVFVQSLVATGFTGGTVTFENPVDPESISEDRAIGFLEDGAYIVVFGDGTHGERNQRTINLSSRDSDVDPDFGVEEFFRDSSVSQWRGLIYPVEVHFVDARLIGVPVPVDLAKAVFVKPTPLQAAAGVQVAGGASVDLEATADLPDGVVSQWTALGGGFADASALSTTWTAPDAAATDEDYEIRLLAVQGDFEALLLSFTATVPAAAAPVIAITKPPDNQNNDGGDVVDVAATVAGGVEPRYEWSSDIGGVFADATALETTWTAPFKASKLRGFLTLTVREIGRTTAARIAVRVRASLPQAAIAMPAANQKLTPNAAIDVKATVKRVSEAATYAWEAKIGGKAAGKFADATARATKWTAPDGMAAEADVVFKFTVTDGSQMADATVTAKLAPATLAITKPPANTTVDSGEVVAVEAVVSGAAATPDVAWSAPSGAFADATALATTWTAPTGTGDPIRLTCRVTLGSTVLTATVDVTVTAPPAFTMTAPAAGATLYRRGNNRFTGTYAIPSSLRFTAKWMVFRLSSFDAEIQGQVVDVSGDMSSGSYDSRGNTLDSNAEALKDGAYTPTMSVWDEDYTDNELFKLAPRNYVTRDGIAP